MQIRFVLPLVLMAFISQAASQETHPIKKLNVAVLDFVARAPVTPDEAATLSDVFTSQLIQTGEFEVLERNQIQALLKEQNFQQSGLCDQVECIVETGKLLKVQRMFAGTVGRLGTLYNVNIRVINVETGKIELDRTRQYDGKIEILASQVIPEFAIEIAEGVTGKRVYIGSSKRGSSSWLWYVGGVAILGGGAAAYLYLRPENKTPTNTDLPGAPKLPGQ